MNIMTRKECLDKIQEAVDNLDTLLAVIKLPSKTTIRWDVKYMQMKRTKSRMRSMPYIPIMGTRRERNFA